METNNAQTIVWTRQTTWSQGSPGLPDGYVHVDKTRPLTREIPDVTSFLMFTAPLTAILNAPRRNRAQT